MKQFLLALLSFLACQLMAQQPTIILDSTLVENEAEKTVFISEFMPYLESCKGNNDDCSNKKLNQFVYSSIQYPDSAKLEGIEGMCVISFTIKKDGYIDNKNIKILKDIGGGCGEAARRVFENVNDHLGKWVTSKDPEKPVDVRLNMPVKFKLH